MRIQPVLTFLVGAALFSAVVAFTDARTRDGIAPAPPETPPAAKAQSPEVCLRVALAHGTQTLAAANGRVFLAMAIATTWRRLPSAALPLAERVLAGLCRRSPVRE